MKLASLVAVSGLTACGTVSPPPATEAPQPPPAAVAAPKAQPPAMTRKEAVLRAGLAARQRLRRVGFRVLRANTPLCGRNVRASFGMHIGSLHSYREAEWPLIRRVMGLTEAPTIYYVIPGSPAGRGGLRKGDVVVAIDGRAVAGATKKDDVKSAVERTLGLIDGRADENRLSITIRRGARVIRYVLKPVTVCNMPIRVHHSDDILAHADGIRIVFTRGVLSFADTDAELALILGHEMAHNLLRHDRKTRGNAGIGTLVDVLLASAGVDTGGTLKGVAVEAYSESFEAEADYIGLYASFRAGYPIAGAAAMWRRLAAATKDTTAWTHRVTTSRLDMIDKTVAEIRGKRVKGEAILPNTRRPDPPID